MTSAPISLKAAEAIAQLAKLLDHPVRVRLMAALVSNGFGSATAFSDQFGDVTVGDCHYHLTALRDGGVIELANSRQVRGATERVYRLRPWSRWHGAQQFRRLVDLLLPITNPDKGPFIAVPLILDRAGFSALKAAAEETKAAMDRIAAESQDRLRDNPSQKTVTVAMKIAVEAADQDGNA